MLPSFSNFDPCRSILSPTSYEMGIFLFTTASRTALGPTQPPIHWIPGVLSLGVKRPGHEANHWPPSSSEVKECVELYIYSHNTHSWRGAQLNLCPRMIYGRERLQTINTDLVKILNLGHLWHRLYLKEYKGNILWLWNMVLYCDWLSNSDHCGMHSGLHNLYIAGYASVPVKMCHVSSRGLLGDDNL
jgi:hypothetical protein